jgi:hypothetical protein
MFRTLTNQPFFLLLALVFACSSCEQPQDAQAVALAKIEAQTDSLLLQEFNAQVTRLQQSTDKNISVLPLAEQIARLPQPLQQAIFVANPDSINGLPDIDSSAPKEIWVENTAMLIGVRDYDAARQKIQNLAAQNEALITAEAERFSEQKLQNTFTIQVPVKNYTILVDAFREMAMILREKSSWREDLSVSWTDVQARLDAKRIAKKRLGEMLTSANKSTDVLPIQRELDALHEEMQTLNRTAQLLRQKTIYSTITLSIYQDTAKPTTAQASFSDRISENAQNGWAHFKNTLIVLSTYWVYLSIGAIFLFVIWLSARRARLANAQQQQAMQNAQQQWLAQTKRNNN